MQKQKREMTKCDTSAETKGYLNCATKRAGSGGLEERTEKAIEIWTDSAKWKT